MSRWRTALAWRRAVFLICLFVGIVVSGTAWAFPGTGVPRQDQAVQKDWGELYEWGLGLPTTGQNDSASTNATGAELLSSNRDAMDRTDDFPRPALSHFNVVDKDGNVKKEYQLPDGTKREGVIQHQPVMQMGLQVAHGNMVQEWLENQEKGSLFTYMASMYETEPASAAALASATQSSQMFVQNMMHAMSNFYAQLDNERPWARALMLSQFRGCLAETLKASKGSSSPQALHYEAVMRCLGDTVQAPSTGTETPSSTDEAFKVKHHVVKRTTPDARGKSELEISIVDTIFDPPIQSQADGKAKSSIDLKGLKQNFLDMYGDKVFKLKEDRQPVDGALASTAWEVTHKKPKIDHAEVLYKLTKARYAELLQFMNEVCQEKRKLLITGKMIGNYAEADDNEPFTKTTKFNEFYKRFTLEGVTTPAILFSLLYDNFKLRYWRYDAPSESAFSRCNEIKTKGELSKINKDTPEIPVYQRYWNYASFVAWGQMLQTYKQSVYLIVALTGEGGSDDINIRGNGLELIEGATGFQIGNWQAMMTDNLTRLEEFKKYLHDERSRLEEGGGSMLASTVASASSGSQMEGGDAS